MAIVFESSFQWLSFWQQKLSWSLAIDTEGADNSFEVYGANLVHSTMNVNQKCLAHEKTL